jgi:hypothetical protein
MLETMPLPDLPAYRTSILYTAAQRPSCRHASRLTLATPRRTLGIATARTRTRRGSTAPGQRPWATCVYGEGLAARWMMRRSHARALGLPFGPGHARVLLAQAEVAPARLPLRPPHVPHSGRGPHPSDGARLSLCCTYEAKKGDVSSFACEQRYMRSATPTVSPFI